MGSSRPLVEIGGPSNLDHICEVGAPELSMADGCECAGAGWTFARATGTRSSATASPRATASAARGTPATRARSSSTPTPTSPRGCLGLNWGTSWRRAAGPSAATARPVRTPIDAGPGRCFVSATLFFGRSCPCLSNFEGPTFVLMWLTQHARPAEAMLSYFKELQSMVAEVRERFLLKHSFSARAFHD